MFVSVLELVYCQGNLVDFGKKYGTLICYIYFEYMRTIDPDKSITDVVMLDWASNVQLGGYILKNHYPKLTVMCEVEHIISIFFDDVSKIPIVNHIIKYHKAV